MTKREKTRAEEAFDRLVREHVAPLLKERCYKKSGLTWRIRREEGPRGWGVVNIQKSQWNSREQISFTVNLGVLWDDAPSSFSVSAQGPSEAICHVRERIGQLMDEPHDHWWEIDGGPGSPGEEPNCFKPIVHSLLPLLEQRGLKWIEVNLVRGPSCP